MIISKRLKTIGDFVNENDVVADIGADHGLLELYLIAKFRNISLLAIENKEGPFSILESKLRAFKNVRLSFSDGLTAVDRTINCLIIAGMGGLNIQKILTDKSKKLTRIKKIIIDAHRDASIARRTLVSLKYEIKSERIVFEQDKFYVISLFSKCDKVKKYKSDIYDIGYKLYEDELWPKYKEYLISKNNKTIEKIKDLENMQDIVLSIEKFNERIEQYGKN